MEDPVWVHPQVRMRCVSCSCEVELTECDCSQGQGVALRLLRGGEVTRSQRVEHGWGEQGQACLSQRSSVQYPCSEGVNTAHSSRSRGFWFCGQEDSEGEDDH